MNTRRVLIVGNTDGIGRALSECLLARGDRVVGVSRRSATLQHPSYQHVVRDVMEPAYASTLRTLLEHEGFDVCVYCAGIGEWLDLTDMRRESAVFQTNLLGLVETASVVLPAMVVAGRGHLVGLSSIGDQALSAEAPSYAASKAGVSSYLAGLALALRPRGVCVSNVRLGFVDTKLAKSRVRPFMISVERAVDVLLRCLQQRPARLTYPWRMELLVRVLRWAAQLELAFR